MQKPLGWGQGPSLSVCGFVWCLVDFLGYPAGCPYHPGPMLDSVPLWRHFCRQKPPVALHVAVFKTVFIVCLAPPPHTPTPGGPGGGAGCQFIKETL
jgi:hypothetical protein